MFDFDGDLFKQIRMEVVLDGLVEDLVRVRAYHREAHQAATLVMAEHLVRIIDHDFAHHHDTNRYINGYITALHDIGNESIPLKPYKKSQQHENFVDRLKTQYRELVQEGKRVKSLMQLAEDYDATAGLKKDGTKRKKRTNQKWYNRMERKLRKIEERRVRAYETLMAAVQGESVLFIHGRAGRQLKSGGFGLSRLHEVRTDIYGGSGSLQLIGDQVIVELHNLEPHSRIIESRPGYGFPYKSAINQLGAVGLKRVSKRYIERQAHLFNRRIVSASEIRSHNAHRHTILFPNDAVVAA